MSEHKKFWKFERRVYRVLIVLCTLALIVAILAWYFLGESGNP
ncbi:hypothetical protein [Muriicola marianensis]|nr:hypothetical protein [Muriicola marianensis]